MTCVAVVNHMERRWFFMVSRFFLGGASPDGFVSDFADEQKTKYGILLKGGPGTGKSTLMRTVASVFADEAVTVYHCASDPRSLDAVVLEERGVFITDATAPHEMSTPLPYITGELVDMAQALDPLALSPKAEEIKALSAENGALHQQCRSILTAVSAMQSVSYDIGMQALQHEKLAGFAKRMSKRLLPKASQRNAQQGQILYRQCSAVTPQGELLFLPPDYGIVLLKDTHHAAACSLIATFASILTHNGVSCIASRSLTLRQKQAVHLLIPECKLAILSENMLSEKIANPLTEIPLKRFYDPEILRRQRSVHRFADKNAALLKERAVTVLQEALAVHDALEKPYIAALQRDTLDAITVAVCDTIRRRMKREYKM